MNICSPSSAESFDLPMLIDKLLIWTLCATFFFIPLLTAPVVIASLIFLGIWLLTGRFWRDRVIWLNQPWTIPVIAIIILQLISLAWSLSPDLRLAERSHFGLFALAIVSIAGLQGTHLLVARAFVAGVGVNVILSIMQFLQVVTWHHPTHKYGFMGYITYSLLVVAGMLILSFLYREATTRHWKIVCLIAMSLFFFNLLILEGRSGYVAFLPALPFIILNIFGKRKLIIIVLLMLLGVSGIAISPTVRERIVLIPQEFNGFMNNPEESKVTSVGLRLYLWKSSVKIFREYPLLGVGTGGFPKAMQKFQNDWEPSEKYVHPHSSYFYIMTSYGILGIFLYTWLIYILLRNSWRLKETISGYCVLSFLLVILVGSLTDIQIFSNATGILFGFLPGFLPGRLTSSTA